MLKDGMHFLPNQFFTLTNTISSRSVSDGVKYSTSEYEYFRKNSSTVRVLLYSNILEYEYSKIDAQVVLECYFSSTPSLKANFAIKGLILSVIQENICFVQRLPIKPPEIKRMHISK